VVVKLGDVMMIVDLHRKGLTVSAIARETGFDRKTVRKYIARGLNAPVYGPRTPRPRLLEPFEAYLGERLKAYPGLTATRLLRELRERGYQGAYSAVRDHVRVIRPALPASFEVRFETPAGQQAQVDFAHFRVVFEDEPSASHVVWLFSMVLGHSRFLWARFVAHQDLQTLIRCHMAAFEALGGVPAGILYDRMKTAVTGPADEGGIAYNAKLLDLAAHYGFVPRACKPYRAKTKGKVERPFGYVRQDFFLAGRFRNLDDLNAQLDRWLSEVANARVHATTRRVMSEAFAEERPALKPLPAGRYRAVLKLERRVSHEGMVSVGGNLYSVPDATRRGVLEVHSCADEIRIFEAGRLIAVHAVLEGRHRRVVAAGHRRLPPPANSRTPRAGERPLLARAGEQVGRRPLALYDAIGRRLAAQGGR
jgi:transposase